MLGPLVPTPRAAKKLLNVYRLIRIGVPDDELSAFVGAQGDGPFRAVLVLLGIVIGHPRLAHPVLSQVRAAAPSTDFLDVLRDLLDDPDHADRVGELRDLVERLGQIAERVPGGLAADVAVYQAWVATTARFSFHTRDLIEEPTGRVPEPGVEPGFDGPGGGRGPRGATGGEAGDGAGDLGTPGVVPGDAGQVEAGPPFEGAGTVPAASDGGEVKVAADEVGGEQVADMAETDHESGPTKASR